MELAKRNNGGWVLVARLVQTGQKCEAPFFVDETSPGKFALYAYGDNDPDMIFVEGNLSKKGVLDLAEVMLPPQWSS